MEELIDKAKRGDKEAFSRIILSLENDLYRIAEVRLENKEDIFDVIQETIITAFNSINKLKQNEYFKTWIIRILINKCNKLYREKYKRNIISIEEIKNSNETSLYDIDKIDEIIDFNFICKNLKYEDKIIISLYYMERFTDKEIGKILNIKESTVTTKRIRAKQKIKKLLEKGGQ